MLSNYYTLFHIARSLNERFSGSTIEAIFSQNKNELAIAFSGGDVLLCSCDPAINYFFLRSAFTRAKKNTVDLFPSFAGSVVRSIVLHPSDRELTVMTEKPERLLIRMYGSKANVLLVNARRMILDAFLRSRELIASKAEEAAPHRPFPATAADFHAQLSAIGHISALGAVKSMTPLLGTLLVREVFVRSNLAEHTTAAEITQPRAIVLYQHLQGLVGQLAASASPRIYREREHPARFAITDLHQFRDLSVERFDSIHEAIRVFLSASRKDRTFHTERDRAIARLRGEKEKIERTNEKIAFEEKESAKRARSAELWGKLLMANLHRVNRGDETVRLDNVFSPEREQIDIPLDTHLSPARNAERYFSQARKSRQSLADQAEHRQQYHDRYEQTIRLLAMLEQVQTAEQWKDFVSDHAMELGLEHTGSRQGKKKETVPFRIFTVEGGFEAWAGKSGENNDLLTTKFARPNDLWFHARGAGGSHVVLRVGTGKGEVSKKAKEQAASIAAFYSKMKNSKLVPVAMTEKKYVHKRKGSPAGTVMVEREKVLMVPPVLPQGKNDD